MGFLTITKLGVYLRILNLYLMVTFLIIIMIVSSVIILVSLFFWAIGRVEKTAERERLMRDDTYDGPMS